MDMRTKLIVSRNLDFKAVVWRRRVTRWIGRRNQLLVGKMFYIFVPVFSELKDLKEALKNVYTLNIFQQHLEHVSYAFRYGPRSHKGSDHVIAAFV